jgi:hypothetical protein
MTREEAIAWRWERAGSSSIDERLVMRCAERGGGCTALPHGSGAVAADAVEMASYAGSVVVCQKHGPSKRFSWMMFVNPDDIMRHANASGGAFAIDELRKYLPRTHLEYRP